MSAWFPNYLHPPQEGWYFVRMTSAEGCSLQVRLFEDGVWWGFSYKEEVDGDERGAWELVPMDNFTHWHAQPTP